MDRDDVSVEADDKVTTSTDTNLQTGQKPVATTGNAADTSRDGSILSDADGDEADVAPGISKAAAQDIPWDTLKAKIAGGDAKRAAELNRYPSLEAWTKSQWALRQKLSSGEYIRKLPEGASDEEKAKWREEMGVPKAPTDYEIPELDGHEWTEADEPILESFLTDLHAADVPQPVVNAALGWYGKFVAEQKEAQRQADGEDRMRATDELRSSWGNEFRPNIKVVDRYLSDTEIFPEGFKDLFRSARASDGRLLINKPGVADWLLSQAKDRYGEGAMLYGDAKVGVTNELAEIDKIMNTDYDRYIKEGLDAKRLEIVRKLDAANGKRKA